MALTLVVEQRLEKTGLVAFFDESRGVWLGVAQKSYAFARDNFPADARVRPDDVAKILLTLLEGDEELARQLSTKKLTQKYWVRFFCDLILDRTWSELDGEVAQ